MFGFSCSMADLGESIGHCLQKILQKEKLLMWRYRPDWGREQY